MTRRDFSRQSFLGEHSEDVLASARVTIAGLGGGGSHVAQQLAHVGIGTIRVIDPQEIEASNLNRLVGATQEDIDQKTPKVDIAKRVITSLRPWIKVEHARSEWQGADHLIRDAHIVVGCVDGYRQRMYLESACRRFGVPYIDIGMDVAKLADGHYAVAGQMITSLPGGPCMRCMGFLTQARLDQEENDYGHAGGNPQVVWTNGTLASLAVGAVVRHLTPWCPVHADYEWLELDGNRQLVSESQQPQYFMRGPCTHFRAEDVGDPFFRL